MFRDVHWGNIFTSIGTVGAVIFSLYSTRRANNRASQRAAGQRRAAAQSVIAKFHSVSPYPKQPFEHSVPGIAIENGSDLSIVGIEVNVEFEDGEDDAGTASKFYVWVWGPQEDGTVAHLLGQHHRFIAGWVGDRSSSEARSSLPPAVRPSAHRLIRLDTTWIDAEGYQWRRTPTGDLIALGRVRT
jgi:hypothetical protein